MFSLSWEPVAGPAAVVGKLCSFCSLATAARVAELGWPGLATALGSPSSSAFHLGQEKSWVAGTSQMTGNLRRERKIKLEATPGCHRAWGSCFLLKLFQEWEIQFLWAASLVPKCEKLCVCTSLELPLLHFVAFASHLCCVPVAIRRWE